ncbi:MAG TPA: response regulator [Magnetospirillaceae bacterium]|nr:response regulator [Magnetospirillaceae bacterium]
MPLGEVLIVDDSFTSRMIIQRCIEMAGIEAMGFRFAENGLDALAALRKHKGIAVVVTDINMPKMNGQTFLRLMKSDPATSGLPAVIVSSIAEGDVDADLGALGAHAIIKKPVSPDKIQQAFGGLS